ncbi:MAG: MoaD/ThiS family protein [Armatimonadetes bacterium]|nr:MoaD/ThiS family protein [Armatimonadota bacterium]
MATVFIPAPLRRVTAGQARVEVPAATVAELVDRLDAQHPGMRSYLLDEGGAQRAYVNIFVNATEIRSLAGLQTPLAERDEVSILPAMAGGGAHHGPPDP